MKKLYIQLIAIILISCSYNSKDGLLFKVKYSPDTKYSETIYRTSETTINYLGSDEFMQKLNDKGISNPTISKTDLRAAAILKMGKLLDGKHFPVTMEIDSCGSSDGKTIIPNGTIIYGEGTVDAAPALDSISSKEMNADVKASMLKALQSMFAQITFPDKKLIVGDTFSHSLPLCIPIAGTSIDMEIVTNYKLVRITNGIASFDITQVFNIKFSEYLSDGSGSGKGQIQYDIAHHNYIYYQESTNFSSKMKINDVKIDFTSKSNFIEKTIISAN